MQTKSVYKGTFHCLGGIYSSEGFKGLYKGISSPIMGVGLVNAIVFGVYGMVQRQTTTPDAISSHFVSGCIAGAVQSTVCSPMELAKTRIQLQPAGVSQYKGPLDCLKTVFRQEGFRGVYRGFSITVYRDIPGELLAKPNEANEF